MPPAGLQGQDRPRACQPNQAGRVADMAQRSDAPSPSPQRRNDESWVEIASQPSSSSLSSIGDDIVTTGLRVGSSSYPPRRRRLHQQPQPHMPPTYIVGHAAAHAGTSSQEEYEESESEEDRVMTSSTEQVHPAASLPRQQTAVRAALDSGTDSDADENATALGRPSSSPTFRPQPNAFSHPPSHLTHRHSTSSAHPYHPSQSRPSIPNRSHTRSHRGAPNYMSPSYQADNDAALRASLTTLLSCAAAARGLPKKDDGRTSGPTGVGGIGTGTGVLPSSQPMELRLVPESELMAESPPTDAPRAGGPLKAPLRTASNSSAPSAPSSTSGQERDLAAEKGKRAAATQNKPARATKKKRTSSSAGIVDGETTTFISPTLLTWVISAGVVVVVSVVGFGAGYVIGREVGRNEGMSLASSGVGSNASATCGQELVRSSSGGTLRRFRWGSVGKSVTA
ncbi:hypothetical protein B0H63DRAFT_58001 [Podospora didyma]|uniref:Uncharacterized protein n=1 Tax=Podospora didyma TaxID=330526 RepID=A0AAE0U8K6_9PEZI|nr:hypothetical protein B0H63DRAFT_58001 [Podospora didyma]